MILNGAALRAIRLRTPGMTVTRAAAGVGVSQPTWSNWERGKRQATPLHVRAICDLLSIDDPAAIVPRELNPDLDDVIKAAA
jgi:transcriptional regulator with XRE-family HTH domain